MIRVFAFFRHYWFGLLISCILLVGFLLFLLILLSPRYDAQKRGFIPCTEALAQNLLSCPKEGQYSCALKHILGNSLCDIKVIGQGWKNWWQGKQATPWANYIFEAEIENQLDKNDEFYADYKKRGITPEAEMQQMIKMNQALEKQMQSKLNEQSSEEKKDEKAK